MADLSKSIKSATSIELNDILNRVRRERECLRLLRNVASMTEPNSNGPYPNWEQLGPFSTETVVWEGKTIKELTDKELGAYMDRLRSEAELANIILDIQNFNKMPKQGSGSDYPNSTPYSGLDLTQPVADMYHKEIDRTLAHFGIPGMRWGHRRQGPPLPSDMANKRQIKSLTKATVGLGKAKTASEEGGKIAGLRRKNKENQRFNEHYDASKKMSDKELQKAVQRLNLEQQYRNLSTRDVKAGKTYVEDFFSVSTSVLAIAGSAAALALTFKQLKGG